MSYNTTIELLRGGETDFGGETGVDFDAALEVLREFTGEESWYDLEWYRELLLGETQRCNGYEDSVEPSLIELTIRFPGVILWVRGLGEDLDDVWLREYHMGKAYQRTLCRRRVKL